MRAGLRPRDHQVAERLGHRRSPVMSIDSTAYFAPGSTVSCTSTGSVPDAYAVTFARYLPALCSSPIRSLCHCASRSSSKLCSSSSARICFRALFSLTPEASISKRGPTAIRKTGRMRPSSVGSAAMISTEARRRGAGTYGCGGGRREPRLAVDVAGSRRVGLIAPQCEGRGRAVEEWLAIWLRRRQRSGRRRSRCTVSRIGSPD
jgi:hypothetical protein